MKRLLFAVIVTPLILLPGCTLIPKEKISVNTDRNFYHEFI
ncbi:hypothetical protein [Chlamydia sp. 17-3921]|nr:hypothetical protein [Chlamydia sp. 17-3921]